MSRVFYVKNMKYFYFLNTLGQFRAREEMAPCAVCKVSWVALKYRLTLVFITK